jgi:hypothetical protein
MVSLFDSTELIADKYIKISKKMLIQKTNKHIYAIKRRCRESFFFHKIDSLDKMNCNNYYSHFSIHCII